MTLKMFLGLLFVCSLVTALLVEAIKKYKEPNQPYNVIVGCSAIVVAVVLGVFVLIVSHAPLTLDFVAYWFLLIVGSWISSMVGYDKVKQTIQQIIFHKED